MIREDFDSEFQSQFSDEEEKEEFERRYQMYKQMRQKTKYEQNKYNNDLFTVKQNDKLKGTLTIKGEYDYQPAPDSGFLNSKMDATSSHFV